MTGLHLTPARPSTAEVDALADLLDGRVGLAGAVADADRRAHRTWAPGRAVHRAWTWEVADRLDARWWPQGVTTSGEAEEPLSRLVLVAWYAKRLPGEEADQGSRVSVLDLDRRRYRHVLLVRPTLEDGVPGLRPLHVHAGGLLWWGPWLHVAATRQGVWSARLDDVLRVPDRVPPGVETHGHRYVLPVSLAHRAGAEEGTEPLRHSFLSRDPLTDDLLVGEYARGSGRAPRRLVRFPMDRETRLPRLDRDGVARSTEVVDGVAQMQGTASLRGRTFASTSHGRWRPGSVWTREHDGGSWRRHRWALPMGPEDLATWPGGDRGDDLLVTATEHPWARWVCTVRRSWFDRR